MGYGLLVDKAEHLRDGADIFGINLSARQRSL